MTTGDRVKGLRMSYNLKQEQLAQLAKTTPELICEWENNISLPDTDTLIRLGELFDVSIDYLLLGERSSTHVGPSLRNRYKHVISIILVVLGSFILAVLPFISVIYQSSIALGAVYTFPYLYIITFPLLPITIWGVIILLIGIHGLKKYQMHQRR